MKRALIVGINDYENEHSHLQGCVEDAKRMMGVLHRHDDCTKRLNYECELLVSSKENLVRRDELHGKLQKLFKSPCDSALLYFSGHGSRDLYGGYLIASDYSKEHPGIAFHDILDLVNQSPVREITIILDCCYSGSMGDDVHGMKGMALLRSGVSILSACSGDEFAKEDGTGGVFTSTVVSALKGQAADVMGNITIAGIYAHADKLLTSWEQRPMFKANIDQLHTIRWVDGKTDDVKIRRLMHFFPDPEAELQLDPSYEKHKCEVKEAERGVHHEEHEKEMRELSLLRAAGLLQPVSHESLYDACIQYGKCRLTPTGKFYWRMVKKGKI